MKVHLRPNWYVASVVAIAWLLGVPRLRFRNKLLVLGSQEFSVLCLVWEPLVRQVLCSTQWLFQHWNLTGDGYTEAAHWVFWQRWESKITSFHLIFHFSHCHHLWSNLGFRRMTALPSLQIFGSSPQFTGLKMFVLSIESFWVSCDWALAVLSDVKTGKTNVQTSEVVAVCTQSFSCASDLLYFFSSPALLG